MIWKCSSLLREAKLCLFQNCHAPQNPENKESRKRTFSKSERHKINALILLFLDKSQEQLS